MIAVDVRNSRERTTTERSNVSVNSVSSAAALEKPRRPNAGMKYTTELCVKLISSVHFLNLIEICHFQEKKINQFAPLTFSPLYRPVPPALGSPFLRLKPPS